MDPFKAFDGKSTLLGQIERTRVE